MGAETPTGRPVMAREEVDRALAQLGAEHEAIEYSLLALQDHAGRRLLEGADLTGVTKDRWAAAEQAVSALWTHFETYTKALRRARELRGRHRWPSREELIELTEMLRGEGIVIPGAAAAAAGAPGPVVGAAGPAGDPGPAGAPGAAGPADSATVSEAAGEGGSGAGSAGSGASGEARSGTAPGAAASAVAVPPGGGGVRLSERLSMEALVERMNGWYAQALDVVAAADSVWSALPSRIDLLSVELQRTRSLAHSVGVRPGEHPAGDDLEQITAELIALRAEVISDPLAYWNPAGGSSAPGSGRPDTARYDRAARALEDVRREIDAVLGVRQDAEQRLMYLRDVLSRADRTLTEARTARGEVLAKIAASEVPVVSGPATVLHEQLITATEYRRHGQWHRLSPLLESLEDRAEEELQRARASLSAVTAPLAVRAELRGRLDAYKAKVTRHGMAEDPLLVELYDLARRMLWTAPCDLRAAEQAVRRFQQAAQTALMPRQGGGPGGGETGGGQQPTDGGGTTSR